jgi:hypothetical protein
MSKKKTTVVQTGLGDEQAATITNNQATMGAAIDDGFSKAAEVGANLTAGQTEIKNNQGTMIGNQDALKTGQANISAQIASIPQTQVVTQQIDTSNLAKSAQVDAGFNNMGTRFDTVDSTLSGIAADTAGLGTKVDTGFEGVNESLDSMGTNIETGFENMDTGFENMQTGFDTVETNRAAMQEAILGGQTALNDSLSSFQDQAQTQLSSLVTGQDSLIEGQGNLQTGLSEFQDQYTTDYAVTSNYLGEMAENMNAGFEATEDNLARNNDEAARAAANANQGLTIEQVELAVQRAIQNANPAAAAGQIDYARIAKEVSTGVSNQVVNGPQNAEEWAYQLNSIRTLITTQGQQMSAEMRYSYGQLANSFDQNGALIADQVDDMGFRTARAIDEQGNLLIAQFDEAGALRNQEQYNINQMLQQMNATLMSFQSGGNYNMGNLSPAYNRGAGGIMSPYSRSMKARRRR